tara:strand:+ start:4 stop:114 length:111 start_codon:yes stop_codon:yes gene_type:complete
VIARNALNQEAEEDIYLPETIDMSSSQSAAPRGGCC